MSTYISVQTDDFDLSVEYQRLRGEGCSDGGIVTFTGLVRDRNLGDDVTGLFLEHYPGMTERALEDIAAQARTRWPVNHISILHRVGQLGLGDQIVFVGASSAHREAAFNACEFMMDYLKSRAPFWKKETFERDQQGEQGRWIEPRDIDTAALDRWESNPS